MYHIKPDKRSLKSATAFCESLAYLLDKKPYNEISISDICHECGIARTTFYRLFDTVDDILIYQFDGLFKESLSSYTTKSQSKNKISYAEIILKIALCDKSLIQAIVSSGRTDLFDVATRESEYTITQNMNLNINEKERIYCTPMLNAMIFAVIKTWVANGSKETADELYQLIKKNLKMIDEYS